MEFRVLRYFITLAQEENITKAAERLHTTQSNVSRQLADLEKTMGTRLFVRGARKITLTEDGLILRKRAEEILELTERAMDELSNRHKETSGVVHIAAIETQYMRLFAEAIKSMQNAYPKIRFDFFSGSIKEISERLDRGLFDFGLLVAPVDMQKYNYIKLPYLESFGLIMRKDSPLAVKERIRPEDIGDYPVWLAQQQLEGNVVSSWLKREVSSLHVIANFNLINTPVMMVENGLGMVFTFDKLVNLEGSNLCFRPLEPKIESELYLVWKKARDLTKVGEIFLEFFQDTILNV